jgi:glucosamine kinase
MFYGHCMCSASRCEYVIGVDAGGTRTRAAVVTLDGEIAGHGTGPGANQNSSEDMVGALTTAVAAALEGIDPALVVGGVFGIAGAGSAGRPRAVTAADAAWRSAGLSGEPHVVTDMAVGFAAASAEPVGIIVFAGTGAGAAVLRDDTIERRADAYGWQVGDDGSAVWIGREAVRAVLRAYDGRGAPTALARTVPTAMLGEAAEPFLAELDPRVTAGDGPLSPGASSSEQGLPQAVLKEVYGRPPADLGRLAPLVNAEAEAGDAVARRIVDEAVGWLLSDVDAVRPALIALIGPDAPYGLVLAGSLLDQGPVADGVRAGLRMRFGVEPTPAGDGAVGAARLAIRRLARRVSPGPAASGA